MWWIAAYLLPLNSFIIYIIVVRDASVAAFVWVYMMPVMSYLMLGRKIGLLLALPFMLIATLGYLYRFGLPAGAAGTMDRANALTCGILILVFVHLYEQVNDRWGHAIGDAALQHICRLLSARLRQTDSIGRLRVEEFGLLLRHTDLEAARPIIESLRLQLSQKPLPVGDKSISLTATFGMAEWQVDGNSADELFRRADERLYRGKALGRNQLISHDVLN